MVRRHAPPKRSTRQRVVLITGASSGIGEATALALAERGWAVVVGARREHLLAELCQRIRDDYAGEAIHARCDVRSEEEVQQLAALAVERYGRLDAVICNAGKGYYAPVAETPPEALRDLFETNVMGVHNMVCAAMPAMRAAGGGHIVVVGSVVGKIAWPIHGPYAATKFALTALTQAMRAELAPSGIRVSLMLPVSTGTDFFATAATPEWSMSPIGPVQPASKVAQKIVRSIEKPRGEVNFVPGMRVAYALAQAAPGLVDMLARLYYRRTYARAGRAPGGPWYARLPLPLSRKRRRAAA